MTKKDKEDLARFRKKERGELIDNCYRAGLISSYIDVPYSTEELLEMYGRLFSR